MIRSVYCKYCLFENYHAGVQFSWRFVTLFCNIYSTEYLNVYPILVVLIDIFIFWSIWWIKYTKSRPKYVPNYEVGSE